ncbi:hypothetical protein [Prosthecobacter fluviatilis]|uniref:Uncharacterized protein n=1 Tax=Prosthecobacter fluviatilis TaxID=445931 RepID=A0ABW0KL94_9BACT
MANLTPQQRQLVEQWAAEGASLNQIQDRLRNECATTLTYMETRLLILELGVKLQDKPREAPPEEKPGPAPAPAESQEDAVADEVLPPDGSAGGALKVSVDDLPPPGAIISGKATFSDGVTVQWFMDQQGRFGMRGPAPGYQPPAADIPAFQSELDTILQLRGF